MAFSVKRTKVLYFFSCLNVNHAWCLSVCMVEINTAGCCCACHDAPPRSPCKFEENVNIPTRVVHNKLKSWFTLVLLGCSFSISVSADKLVSRPAARAELAPFPNCRLQALVPTICKPPRLYGPPTGPAARSFHLPGYLYTSPARDGCFDTAIGRGAGLFRVGHSCATRERLLRMRKACGCRCADGARAAAASSRRLPATVAGGAVDVAQLGGTIPHILVWVGFCVRGWPRRPSKCPAAVSPSAPSPTRRQLRTAPALPAPAATEQRAPSPLPWPLRTRTRAFPSRRRRCHLHRGRSSSATWCVAACKREEGREASAPYCGAGVRDRGCATPRRGVQDGRYMVGGGARGAAGAAGRGCAWSACLV
eukprot:37897-Chlamydomonas_euryale.AAC.19